MATAAATSGILDKSLDEPRDGARLFMMQHVPRAGHRFHAKVPHQRTEGFDAAFRREPREQLRFRTDDEQDARLDPAPARPPSPRGGRDTDSRDGARDRRAGARRRPAATGSSIPPPRPPARA